MAFYEYCSKVYKATLSNEERRKLSKNKSSVVERGRRPQPRYLFIDGHPQTETHLQIVRAEPIVPSLSFLPPSEESNKEKFHICMLLLFKPFSNFSDLYNGISWENTYLSAEFGRYLDQIKNIKEMHIGLIEKEDNRSQSNLGTIGEDVQDENDDIDFLREEVNNNHNSTHQLLEKDIDLMTSQALDIIKSSGWLNESNNSQSILSDNHFCSSASQQLLWKKDIKTQGEKILENMYTNENEEVENQIISGRSLSVQEDNSIEFSAEIYEEKNLDIIITNIVTKFSL